MTAEIGLTIIRRPYVFALLALFLISSIRARGTLKTLGFLAWGYGVAWASEALSIRTGIPYGLYHYNQAAFGGELSLMGVPVFDSISYTFMVYAAYCVAHFLSPSPFPLPPGERGQKVFPPPSRGGGRGRVVLITAILTTLLDVIVDPLAVLGEEWFLGPIFHYAYPGIYFGVPVSNFAGWFIVAFAIAWGYHTIDSRGESPTSAPIRPIREGILLYFLIGLFNVGITLAIGRWALAAASTGWLTAAALLMRYASPGPLRLRRK